MMMMISQEWQALGHTEKEEEDEKGETSHWPYGLVLGRQAATFRPQSPAAPSPPGECRSCITSSGHGEGNPPPCRVLTLFDGAEPPSAMASGDPLCAERPSTSWLVRAGEQTCVWWKDAPALRQVIPHRLLGLSTLSGSLDAYGSHRRD